MYVYTPQNIIIMCNYSQFLFFNCFSLLLAYTMAKYGMSLCVLGMAKEFEESGVAVNALWPRTS